MIFRASRKAEPATSATEQPARFPGTRAAMDGSTAIVAMETAASEGAGAYPITPSTQMGEGWAVAVAEGKTNVNGRRLLFFEPEGEHAAAAVTAGMSMVGLRATNFSSGQGIAYMHESLYAAVGKRLTYVLNMATRAMTKHALNVHAGHDDYHCVDDTGFFQVFAKDVQESADLNLIAHRVAELSLNPGICAQDGFLTSHVIESIRLPERDLVKAYLGDPADLIAAPTPAQRLVFGERRRRIPELFDLDYPAMIGTVQNQDAYAQGVAAQRPFYFDHVAELADQAMAEFHALTGRRYARASGYRLADARYVIVGQGSVVANAEAVADWMRATKGLAVGVLNLTMFRPFPADLVTALLAGKEGVVVLERTDQPLAVDPPLLREIRAAMAQARENGRWQGERPRGERERPYPRLAALAPEEVPDFFSGCFGLGSRDLQPGDIVAAVENMLPASARRRQFYLGVDFVRKGTRLPKLQIWQEQLLESYPRLADLTLPTAGDLDLLPKGSVSIRIHSVGGWGAITMGKNLALTAFELFGLHIKANPKYGSEKKGQPTTFYATLAHEAVKLNCELKHVDVVLSPDPNVFRHSNPLAGLSEGGAFVIQSELAPDALWASLPAPAQREILEKGIRVYGLDAFRIAGDEASEAELRYRMQGAAFMGAFFRVSPLLEREGMDAAKLFEGVRKQLAKKFGKLGDQVVEDNLRVIRRGFEEVRALETAGREIGEAAAGSVPVIHRSLDVPAAAPGLGNPGRFWEQVCFVNKAGQDVLADPFTAISAIPAATSAVRDMTGVRYEVPEFLASKCTGCAQCWTQCPDAAIPGLVHDVEEIVATAIKVAADGGAVDRVRQIAKHLAKESRKLLRAQPFTVFADTLAQAYQAVAPKVAPDAAKRSALDAEFERVRAAIGEFPLARTKTFFDVPESRKEGTGGLLSITINPEACKGCMLCVDVCPDGALVAVKQEEPLVEKLRRNWSLWERLPDTDDRFINVASIEEGIGVLPSLLLKKKTYRSMAGGDGACVGCGEKTSVHLIVSAIEAMMQPRVAKRVTELDRLIAELDAKARALVAARADLDAASAAPTVSVEVPDEVRAQVDRLNRAKHQLEDLRWRYVEGPGGKGRASMGMANSTGCSSVWASTFPYNPYPFPWTNHLFQDAPSLAIGIFEGHMRKMADGFIAERRARALLDGSYDAAAHEADWATLSWQRFSDEEFALCPPIVAMGGDGAMLDIGFQNLSRLMASGKPLRVIVLDTQVYSNTGGQACTSGFTGQVSDMAAWGAAQHGKAEVRKELALIAIAHRGVYVHQSSQASASHLLAGVLKGLQKRRPAIFNIYTPCPVEHGLADDWARSAARLALEARAFPYITYDPDAGPTVAECLSLEGNPAIEDTWPSYTLSYVTDDGAPGTMELPLTIADWAATEGRFKKHFKGVKPELWNEDMVPFHEWMGLAPDEREGKTPFIHAIDGHKRLTRLSVSPEIVALAGERMLFWNQLRELAGLRTSAGAELEAEMERRVAEVKAEYEGKLQALRATYPAAVARKLAETLLKSPDRTVAEILTGAAAVPFAPAGADAARGAPPEEQNAAAAPAARHRSVAPMTTATPPAPAPAAPAPVAQIPAAPAPAAPPSLAAAAPDAGLAMEPYIETERCTSCNECTGVSAKLFGYNAQKQAYIKDPRAGTFQQLVLAAERCPAGLIHPGTPLNPKEKDLARWVKRAERFA